MQVSLDLASFEVVRGCAGALLGLLHEGLLDIVFCNEVEAAALAEVLPPMGSSVHNPVCCGAVSVRAKVWRIPLASAVCCPPWNVQGCLWVLVASRHPIECLNTSFTWPHWRQRSGMVCFLIYSMLALYCIGSCTYASAALKIPHWRHLPRWCEFESWPRQSNSGGARRLVGPLLAPGGTGARQLRAAPRQTREDISAQYIAVHLRAVISCVFRVWLSSVPLVWCPIIMTKAACQAFLVSILEKTCGVASAKCRHALVWGTGCWCCQQRWSGEHCGRSAELPAAELPGVSCIRSAG